MPPKKGASYYFLKWGELMIIIDESRLTHDTIAKIGRDCGMEYDYENYTAESYEEFVKSVVERYKFDTEMLS